MRDAERAMWRLLREVVPEARWRRQVPIRHFIVDFASHRAKLVIEIVRCLDVIAPRKFATIRHAGELMERRGFVDELNLTQLPLVPKILGGRHNSGR